MSENKTNVELPQNNDAKNEGILTHPPKTRKKRKWGKWVIIAVAIVAIAGFAYYSVVVAPVKKDEKVLEDMSSIALERSDLMSTIDVSGIIESDESVDVYSRLTTYPIIDVKVEVGDKVSVGDLLLELDVAALDAQIRQTEASISSTEGSIGANINSAQRGLQTALDQLNEERSAVVSSAKNGLDSAQAAYDNALKVYDEGLLMFDLGEMAQSDLDSLRNALTNAETALNSAQKMLDDSYKTAEDSVKAAEDSVKTAKSSGDTSSQRIAVQELQRQKQDAQLLSPAAGTITLVNANEGSYPQGIVFVIEDLDHLKIKTNVREYDAPSVAPGMKVIIKTDATGNEEFSGVVRSVAPTANKGAQLGGAIQSASVEFETIVDVINSSNVLKIGMNTQLYLIKDSSTNVFAVSYSSIGNEDGQDFIVVKETDDKGANVMRKIDVEVGLETDYLVEIKSPVLIDGLNIIDDISKWQEYMETKAAKN